MGRFGAAVTAMALRASFMFAERELKPVAGVIEKAAAPVIARAAPSGPGALIVQIRTRFATPRFAANTTASLAFALAA